MIIVARSASVESKGWAWDERFLNIDADQYRIARDRVTSVFKFLRAYNQHKNPPKKLIREQQWSLWMDELPNHPSVRIGQRRISESAGDESELESEIGPSAFLLKVSRPKLLNAPRLPLPLERWTENGWDDPFKDVSVRKSVRVQLESGEPRDLAFEDDRDADAAYRDWLPKRDAWARAETPARNAMKVFERLYELRGVLARESERSELILGDGILNWKKADGAVSHPVLLERVQLVFDPAIPEFSIVESDGNVELYAALFQTMNDVDGKLIGECVKEVEEGDYRQFGDDSTSGFLRRLASILSPKGEFIADGRQEDVAKDFPRITRSPVFFLRSRTLGFAAALDAILEDIRSREDIPSSLLNIVGIDTDVAGSNSDGRQTKKRIDPDELLLSKPANREQIRIAQELESSGGVLVQGPPGTGKTHTIGNLIGHLLANGKSVLVTSHTTKALKNVQKYVVEKLQPLCVSVLESDLTARNQLEGSVNSIASRLSQLNVADMSERSQRLTVRRREIQRVQRELKAKLQDARMDEYRDVVVSGKTWSPRRAAEFVAGGVGRDNWIPGKIKLNRSLPLSTSEALKLYATNQTVPVSVERELAEPLLDVQQLPGIPDFEQMIATRDSLLTKERDLRDDLWGQPAQLPTPDWLKRLGEKIEKALDLLPTADRWRMAAASAGRQGKAYTAIWDNLLTQIEVAEGEILKSQELLLRHAVTVSVDGALEDSERTANEILEHFRGGAKLGVFALLTHGNWKALQRSTTVNGGQPESHEHFQAVAAALRTRILRRDLGGRWDRQMGTLGAPPSHKLGGEIEKGAAQYCDPIRAAVRWTVETWKPIEDELKSYGFLWDRFIADQPPELGEFGELRRLHKAVRVALLPVLVSRIHKLEWQSCQQMFAGLREKVRLAAVVAPNSEVTAALLHAVEATHSAAYRSALARLVDCKAREQDCRLRHNMLAKLEEVAPGWSATIRERTGAHGFAEPPGDPESAWTWAQLFGELEERAGVSLDSLQAAIEAGTRDLEDVTTVLIDTPAWAAQARRTTLAQRQALIGWLDMIRRIGKGTGIQAPRLRREAAKLMSECRGAVPVWIMPISRVVENFDPRVARFDVVIIDEASQSDAMALVAVYLAKTVIVVGDNEQVSPSAIGEELGIIKNLQEQFLESIPNSVLYGGKTSVYDLAHQSFGETIRLTEHFRCVTEIIQFSNHLCYNGQIQPLRDGTRSKLKPHTVEFRVTGSSRNGKVNREEAVTVASLVAAAVEMPEYQENEFGSAVSFGVISLLGEEQALEIATLLRRRLPAKIADAVLCGTASQFQGDEKDVMFLSTVGVADGGPLRFQDQDLYKQRFNVAASRARDQMWVVHSLNCEQDLKDGDLRRRLIEHAKDPNAVTHAIEENNKRTESHFEREVMKRLMLAGYRVKAQFPVGCRRIDLVVEGDERRRLAVECDGEQFHTLENLSEDMERQSQLERLGWTFSRIRGSVFYRDADRAMKEVFAKLDELEIAPNWSTISADVPPAVSRELVDRVIRRAEQIRSEWASDSAPSLR
jgi:very-short-patch-repair endonuclease